MVICPTLGGWVTFVFLVAVLEVKPRAFYILGSYSSNPACVCLGKARFLK